MPCGSPVDWFPDQPVLLQNWAFPGRHSSPRSGSCELTDTASKPCNPSSLSFNLSVVMLLNEYNVAYDVLPKDLWCSSWQRSVETSLRTLAWAACLGGRGAGECSHHKLSQNFGSLHELANPRG